jgi:DNA repair protein RecO
MSHEWEKQEGVLLQSISYLSNHRILKIFAPDAGLLTLIAKHIHRKNAAHTIPFCRSEWVFRKSQGEIYLLKDATLLDPFQGLKENYQVLTAAGSIATDLLRSQFPHRPARGLYELLIATLTHLRRNPLAIQLSFRLKLLQYEGLVHLQPACTLCSAAATHVSRGECLCPRHLAFEGVRFEEPEWQMLLQLSLGRRFSEFDPLQPSLLFIEKVDRLFTERMQH